MIFRNSSLFPEHQGINNQYFENDNGEKQLTLFEKSNYKKGLLSELFMRTKIIFQWKYHFNLKTSIKTPINTFWTTISQKRNSSRIQSKQTNKKKSNIKAEEKRNTIYKYNISFSSIILNLRPKCPSPFCPEKIDWSSKR